MNQTRLAYALIAIGLIGLIVGVALATGNYMVEETGPTVYEKHKIEIPLDDFMQLVWEASGESGDVLWNGERTQMYQDMSSFDTGHGYNVLDSCVVIEWTTKHDIDNTTTPVYGQATVIPEPAPWDSCPDVQKMLLNHEKALKELRKKVEKLLEDFNKKTTDSWTDGVLYPDHGVYYGTSTDLGN